MYAAILLPRFALQAVLRSAPGLIDKPVAVLDVLATAESNAQRSRTSGRGLLHVNIAAERQGIHSGMADGMAMARCPRLQLLPRDLDAELSAQHLLIEHASAWSPDYEAACPGLCILDISRVRGLLDKLEECSRTIHDQLGAHLLDARIGCAPNADLAVLAAHAAQPILIWCDSDKDTTGHLHALSLSSLHPSAETAELLRLWGIRTLGDLVRLPRQSLASRLGAEGIRLWDLAAGGRERLLRLFRPTVHYREEAELEHPVESLEPLLFLLKRQLNTLCHRLAESWIVAEAIDFTLRFEDLQRFNSRLRIAEPTRDPDLLLRLLHTHLEEVTAPAPIIHVLLELIPCRPAGSQMQIFERGMRDPNRFAETLTQIEAIVGNANAGRIKRLPSRALDAFEVVAFLDDASAARSGTNDFGFFAESLMGLPLRRIRPVHEVEVIFADDRPLRLQTRSREHQIIRTAGPWLVSGDWWDEAMWQREIWEVETSEGILYQLTRYNTEWTLEGVFG